MSNDNWEQLKAKLEQEAAARAFLPEAQEIHLSPKLNAELEAREAASVLTRWSAGETYLRQVDQDLPTAVLRVFAAMQAYLVGVLLDARSPESRLEPHATIGCERGQEPYVDIVPAAGSRLARAHDWRPSPDGDAQPLHIAGYLVSSHIASMLGTTDDAGQWFWKKQCELLREWNDDFECLFSELDIDPRGRNDVISVSLKDDDED